MRPYIIDVHLSITDETYYPLNGRSKYNGVYSARSREELLQLLEKDGWRKCGAVLANDNNTMLDMFHKKPTAAEQQLVSGSFIDRQEHLIAIAEEI